MKLSMWILYDWMKEYSPVATISDGEMTIEGVRFISDSSSYDKRHVYVSTAHNNSDEVLLINNNDVISLRTNNPEEVFNKVLAAFDYYNKWEADVLQAAKGDNPEQNILDASKDIFGPLFMIDLNLTVVAFTNGYQIGEINPIWDEFIQTNNISLNTIRELKDAAIFRLTPHIQNCTVYDNSYLLKYVPDSKRKTELKAMMISYCIKGELAAQIIYGGIGGKQTFSRGEVQLANSLQDMTEEIETPTVLTYSDTYSNNILKKVLTTGILESDDKNKILIFKNWQETDPFCLAVFMVNGTQSNALFSATYARRIGAHLADCLAINMDDRVVCLKRIGEYQVFVDEIEKMADALSLQAGISYVFRDLCDYLPFYQQAFQAYSYAVKKNRTACEFSECALHTLTHNNRVFNEKAVHPVVKALMQYDQENNAELGNTLRVFLRSERSYSDTAKALFIHRNTVLYRMNKIVELVSLKLDDPDEREYILTSFRIMDP